MIHSSHWSRYNVARERPRPRRRLLLLLPLAALLVYVLTLVAGVDWAHTQTIPLLDLAGQRWEFYWAPEPPTTALWQHDLGRNLVTNLLQVRW
jgi:hypothetical protein